MNHDPWMDTVWSERQVAWCLAGLPELHYEAEKVEGETVDAPPKMGAHPQAFEAYLASGKTADLASRRPVVIGSPTLSGPTAEGEPAYEQLELLRKAVRFRRLHPADGLVIYWDRVRGYWNQTHIDDMPEDAEPIRFKVETGELARWMESERMPYCTALAHKCGAVRGAPDHAETSASIPGTPSSAKGNGLRVAAIRLIKAGGLCLGNNPHAVITDMNDVLRRKKDGVELPVRSPVLRDAVTQEAQGAAPDYPARLPSKGQPELAALWRLVGYVHEVGAADVDALLELFKGGAMNPPPRELMVEVAELM